MGILHEHSIYVRGGDKDKYCRHDLFYEMNQTTLRGASQLVLWIHYKIRGRQPRVIDSTGEGGR